MIPPLRSFLIVLWVACVAGAVVIAGLALDYYTWMLFVIAAIIGLVVGVPAALLTWAKLRPNRARRWEARRKLEQAGIVPPQQ